MTFTAAQLRSLLSDITEGKWSLLYTGDRRITGDLVAVEDGEHADVVSCDRGVICEADGLLIEAAPELAKQLLAMLEEATGATQLEGIARAICRASGANPDQPVYRNGDPASGVLYHKWALYREEAKAAIKACRVEAILSALRMLVAAKDEKEKHGETERYRELKERGWREARAIVASSGKREEQPA